MLKLLIWAKYISYLLILNCLHGMTSEQLVIPTLRKTGFLMQVSVSVIFYEGLKKKVIMFQATVLLPQISEDLTIFFFKLLLTSVENHTKADFLFLCQHTILPQYFIVNCRSNNKNYNVHSRTRTKEVLRNAGR